MKGCQRRKRRGWTAPLFASAAAELCVAQAPRQDAGVCRGHLRNSESANRLLLKVETSAIRAAIQKKPRLAACNTLLRCFDFVVLICSAFDIGGGCQFQNSCELSDSVSSAHTHEVLRLPGVRHGDKSPVRRSACALRRLRSTCWEVVDRGARNQRLAQGTQIHPLRLLAVHPVVQWQVVPPRAVSASMQGPELEDGVRR